MADVLTAQAVRDAPGGRAPTRRIDDIVRSAA
ncbi:hypothetical protein GA0074695_1351 [Micromonospora viridifaciens]|uniref:Uncharacterized protein n=1 Tax=Micromonospora viridifaciens TaxID=1881 RepID=A0A1C4VD64_MICVI|nr:hypothetical protein GA0074695_1351 [Micromonospora viridifaciens]